jgi:hypothetical protein
MTAVPPNASTENVDKLAIAATALEDWEVLELHRRISALAQFVRSQDPEYQNRQRAGVAAARR